MKDDTKTKGVRTGKLEFAAYTVLGLLSLAFPVLIFYIVPLVVIDTTAPIIAGNYFAS